jgi:DNA-binding PadR family transcriptional regulator
MSDETTRGAEAPFLVLASLAAGPKHGYAITQDVAEQVGVNLGPGTLYGVISRLEERGLIRALPPEERRRPYELTAAGATALAEQSKQLRAVADLGLSRLRMTVNPA